MSRIGKKPIEIPQGVEIKIEKEKIIVKGPKGELCLDIRPEIKVAIKDNKIFVSPQIESKKTKALWGLFRALIANMLKGVTVGYEKKLQLEGIGYKANLEAQDLVLELGFSHSVKVKAPENIKFSVEKNIITVTGINKQLVGNTAAKIRALKKPEPYKGKGIRYVGEIVRRKVGKKAATTE